MMNYNETCRKAEAVGLVPDFNASDDMKKRLNGTVYKVMSKYAPIEGEAEITGFFLYYPSQQAGDLRETLALTEFFGDNTAIIGMSYDVMKIENPVYEAECLLHELAHLYADGVSSESHGEVFQDRFNEIEYDFFAQTAARFDSKMKRKAWKK